MSFLTDKNKQNTSTYLYNVFVTISALLAAIKNNYALYPNKIESISNCSLKNIKRNMQ